MAGGRPSKLKEVDLDQVEGLATRGWTDQEMADHFKVARSTWYKWKVDYPEFSDALKNWKQEADERVERSLYERALGYSHPEEKIFNDGGEALRVQTVRHYPPDTTAGIFWLKNRKPDEWRDKQDVVHALDEDTAELLDARRKRASNAG
ncbi:MAG: hypothetical protein AAGF20_00135 [Pseudomonadota bacterium]